MRELELEGDLYTSPCLELIEPDFPRPCVDSLMVYLRKSSANYPPISTSPAYNSANALHSPSHLSYPEKVESPAGIALSA